MSQELGTGFEEIQNEAIDPQFMGFTSNQENFADECNCKANDHQFNLC